MDSPTIHMDSPTTCAPPAAPPQLQMWMSNKVERLGKILSKLGRIQERFSGPLDTAAGTASENSQNYQDMYADIDNLVGQIETSVETLTEAV